MELGGHLDFQIGLDIPSVDEFQRGWSILRIPFRSAVIGPRDQRGDLCLGETTFVREMTHLWISEPGWHLLAHYGDLDGLSPRPRFSVAHQGERCDLPRAMAGLTVFLQNWQHVLLESNRWCRRTTDNGHCAYRHCEDTQTRHGKASRQP